MLVQLRANAEQKMCDKCVELDGKIEHYERISASISDQLTIDRIKELVEQMKAQKSALHPKQE
jgi:FAD/FMN-containing dehydrogenase